MRDWALIEKRRYFNINFYILYRVLQSAVSDLSCNVDSVCFHYSP